MERMVEMGDVFVLPVCGKRVLHEVVGPDAEKARAPRQVIGRQGSARGLDHHSDWELAIEGHALPRELLGDFRAYALGLVQFRDSGHQREHDSQWAQRRGSVERS